MFTPSPALLALLAANRFLRLTSSKEVYPDSRGTGLPLLQVVTDECNAMIALQGAQLLAFQPLDKATLLWLSPNCDFTGGTALRGGIPVCLPWFGPHPQNPTKPKHGFARTQTWTLTTAQMLEDGNCELTFGLHSEPNALFDYHFDAQLCMTLGRTAKLGLSITNRDTRPFDCSWALHSYHPVDSLANARVYGLSGKTYLDNLEGLTEKKQLGDVVFKGEVDRVFPGIDNPLSIGGSPEIKLTHYNCPSVIVWNPGAENAAAIADIGAGNEQGYICVERGAVLDEKWHLSARETRSGWLEISAIGDGEN
jgi:glucose-6-phosphate 1-epimerase